MWKLRNMDFNSEFISFWLCGPEQVAHPLWEGVYSSIESD